MDGTSDNSGCLNQFILFVLVFWFGAGAFTGTQVEVAPPPSTITIASSEEDLPFALQDDTIMLGTRSTLERPCVYVVEGYAFDLEGNTFADYDVYVRLADDASEEAEMAGTYLDGSWNYGGFLSSDNDVEVWMTLKDSEERVSPIVTVPGIGCDYNVAAINFVQIRPISQDEN